MEKNKCSRTGFWLAICGLIGVLVVLCHEDFEKQVEKKHPI